MDFMWKKNPDVTDNHFFSFNSSTEIKTLKTPIWFQIEGFQIEGRHKNKFTELSGEEFYLPS